MLEIEDIISNIDNSQLVWGIIMTQILGNQQNEYIK